VSCATAGEPRLPASLTAIVIFGRADAGDRRPENWEADAEQVKNATIMPAVHHRPPCCG
jgi:hypothetical protein